jgi:signal transduction histidine kinase
MSTAIWGEPESQQPEEVYPRSLLKHLLHRMMVQFSASGACIALHDENIELMEIRLHLRLRNSSNDSSGNTDTTPMVTGNGVNTDGLNTPDRTPTTVPLSMDPSSSAITRLKRPSPALSLADVEEITPQQNELFPVGATYAPGQDLVGYVWHKNETHIMRQDDYLAFFYSGPQMPLQMDVVPTWYLAVPVQESTLVDEVLGKRKQPRVVGVVILYQTTLGAVFQQRQRAEARDFAERIALYLQNDRLRRRQRRTSEYLKQMQEISTAFPSSVQLARLLEDVYRFASNVVDVSSMLITFYDRDTKLIYDVFAIQHRTRLEGLIEHPRINSPRERPVWWRITQEEKQTLLLEPVHEERGDYDEVLNGTWGDQSKAGSFLLLPMKMFNRVTGSLCLTSTRTRAYSSEEILVLETMVQIITVSIENAKLYENTRKALRETSQREELLAAMNSALQMISISTALDVTDIQHKFVESAAKLVQADVSIFFQCTNDRKHLVAQVTYESSKAKKDGNSLVAPKLNKDQHQELIEQIRLPFKGSSLGTLERLVDSGFFYLDQPMAEELARECDESGAIFLLETHIQKMLMIPVLYQAELIGVLGIHTPKQVRNFRPTEIGMLLALSAQAASAIRNAQLFEQVQEAYAEQQQLDKLKDEFLVTASHELRTPLSAISGYSTLLKRQSNRITPQQILRFATKIAGATQQLTDLVSSMTEAARMGTVDKKLDLQIAQVPLQAAVEMAVSMLSVNVEQKMLTQVSPDLWVSGDPLRVRQVISNLLDNAAKYSTADSRIEIIAGATILSKVDLPDDQIDFDADTNMPVVLVQIYDEGEGITLEDQQRIFEKFVRATRSLTTPIRGSGLGLYICRRYIEAMGGRLWLQHSIPGEGSAFSFYLPRAEALIETDKSEQGEMEKERT